MKPRTALKRYTPIRKRRATPRRGQPTNAEKATIRLTVYKRCRGMCQLRLMPNCMIGPLPFDGPVRQRWHLVHLRAKRRFGWTEEQGNTLLGGCPICHLDGMHTKGLKPEGS